MFTYSYESPNIIQIVLKRLHESGDSAVKKTLADLALPLQVVKELLKKCPYALRQINYVGRYINCEDLLRTAGGSWMRVAEDQARWRAIGEVYVQQWTVVGC
jgi:hypothetical protein